MEIIRKADMRIRPRAGMERFTGVAIPECPALKPEALLGVYEALETLGQLVISHDQSSEESIVFRKKGPLHEQEEVARTCLGRPTMISRRGVFWWTVPRWAVTESEVTPIPDPIGPKTLSLRFGARRRTFTPRSSPSRAWGP